MEIFLDPNGKGLLKKSCKQLLHWHVNLHSCGSRNPYFTPESKTAILTYYEFCWELMMNKLSVWPTNQNHDSTALKQTYLFMEKCDLVG